MEPESIHAPPTSAAYDLHQLTPQPQAVNLLNGMPTTEYHSLVPEPQYEGPESQTEVSAPQHQTSDPNVVEETVLPTEAHGILEQSLTDDLDRESDASASSCAQGDSPELVKGPLITRIHIDRPPSAPERSVADQHQVRNIPFNLTPWFDTEINSDRRARRDHSSRGGT